jgi:hypothetical protein
MNKKEVVVEAYGPYYLTLSEFIDDEGCVMQLKVDGIRLSLVRQERMLEWRPAPLDWLTRIMMTKPYTIKNRNMNSNYKIRNSRDQLAADKGILKSNPLAQAKKRLWRKEELLEAIDAQENGYYSLQILRVKK